MFINKLNAGLCSWFRLFMTGIIIVSLVSCYKPDEKEIPRWKLAMTKADLLSSKDSRGAIRYLDSVYRTISNPSRMVQYERFTILRKCHHNLKLYPDVVLLCDSTLQILKVEPTNELAISEIYLEKGDVLMLLKNYRAAYKSYYKGLEFIGSGKSPANRRLKSRFYSRLADICYGQNKYGESIAWHRKSLQAILVAKTVDSSYYLVQGTYNNIGLCFLNDNKADSAIKYFCKANQWNYRGLAENKISGKDAAIAEGVISGNEGSAYLKKGITDSAELLFLKDIRLNDKPGYAIEDALITKRKLAALYVKDGNLQGAVNLLRQIKSSGLRFSSQSDRLDFVNLEIQIAEKQKNFDTLSHFFHQYVDLRDSIYASRKTYLSANLENEFVTLNNQDELTHIKKDDLIKTIVLVALCVLLFACAYLTIINIRVRKRIQSSKDETEERNEKLKATLQSLEASFIENTKLLGIVAHDLKNPLNAIYGLSNLLAENSNLADEDAEMVSLIMSSSQTMSTIIDDLLSSKKHTDIHQAYNTKNHIKDLVTESISLLKNRAEEKQIELLLATAEDCVVTIHRQQIWRVINNLLVNAIKFSAAGSKVIIGVELTTNGVRISIQDSGIGIPEHLKPKIFALTGEAKREGTSGEETYGMGLYISRQIIEEHGGDIGFESTEGVGSTFFINLPCSD